MSLESKISKNVFQGNGTTKTFSFTFRVWKEDQVLVYVGTGDETETDVTSSCSITLSENGGTVTFPTAPAAGTTIAVTRNMPFIQEDQYITGARFDPHEIEDRLDQDCAERQQLLDGVGRAVKVPNTSDKTPEQFVQQLFTARDEAQAAASAAQAAQTAAETCRDEACECASEAAATLDSAITVIKEQEQASVEVVKKEGDEQAKRLEDIATTILISAASYNKSVSVKLTSPITNGETYTLPESLAYLVGRAQLLVSGNGVWFYNGFQYEEVGTDGVASSQITFLQDLAVDDVLTFTLLANRVNLLTSTDSGLVNDNDGYVKVNVDGQTVLINASGQVYVPVMVGATADKAGTAGLAPAAAAGKQNKPLTGGGEYADSLDCDITGHASEDLPRTGGSISGSLSVSGFLSAANTLKVLHNNILLGFSSETRTILRCDGKAFYILKAVSGSEGFTTDRFFTLNLATGDITVKSVDIADNSDKICTTKWCRVAINQYAITKVEFFTGTGSFSRTVPAGGTWRCIMLYNNGGASKVVILAGGSNWSESPGTGYHCFMFKITA